MEETVVFDTLNEAIAYAFKLQQTTVLNLDQICAIFSLPHLMLKNRSGVPIACSTVTRRRISSTLSSSEIFHRAGPPRTCLWAIRSNHPLFVSDAAITASVEQMLTAHGPLTSEQFACLTALSGLDLTVFERFFEERPEQYSRHEDGTWWFAGRKRPTRVEYDSMGQALMCAFAEFPDGATVEDLHWVLCLSTVGRNKAITRRRVSRELSRRTDLFAHVSRAKYAPLHQREPQMAMPCPVKVAWMPAFPQVEWDVPSLNHEGPIAARMAHEEEDFNPFAFFTGEFHFAYE
jgi:hypothetical protein